MPSPYAFDPAEWPRLAEVMRFWESRRLLTSTEYAKLSQAARGRAGSLAGVMETGFVDDIYRLIRDQLTGDLGGLSSAAFRTEADKLIAKYGGGDLVYSEGEQFSAWYAETVFRTNVQAAFAAARYAEMFSAEGKTTAEYWLFDAIVDDRNDSDKKCPDMICRSLNGKVFAKDDAAAAKWLPPLHFNCRCSAIELDAQDVEDGGYGIESGGNIASDDKDVWQDDKVESLTGEFLPGIEPSGVSAPLSALDELPPYLKGNEPVPQFEFGATGDEPLPAGEEPVFEGALPPDEVAKHGDSPKTGDEVIQLLRAAGMSDDEAARAIREVSDYTTHTYTKMNLALWRGEVDAATQERVQAIVGYLDAMPPLPAGTEVWRATGMSPAQLGRLRLEGQMTESSFWSATTFDEVAEARLGMTWRLEVPDSRAVMVHISNVTTGKSIIATSGMSEMEVLFKPGTKFRFLRMVERAEEAFGHPIIDLYLEEI